MSLKKVVECVKRNKRFLITTHTNPEGDALGAELAFYMFLKKMGKSALIINDDSVPATYAFLPHLKNIRQLNHKLKKNKFDCFVILDCSDLARCGEVSKFSKDIKTSINIDHHISNGKFATINWVEPGASSASEMVYKLYKKMHLPLDKDIAMCLYVGMLTDTGSFRYPNTTALTHKTVSELLKFNLNSAQIYKNIYESVPFQDLQLLSKILPNLKVQFNGKVAWVQIRQDLLKGKKISLDLSEHILSFARAIKDVEAVVLFKENLKGKNEIRVNLRSQGKIDVNKIAHFFGGGGHKTASGCTIRGKIDEVRRKVLAKIREALV